MNRFPILGTRSQEYIPWDVIAPHEKQALQNHGQTLERLAERGGLDYVEALAVLEDRPYECVGIASAKRAVLRITELFRYQMKEVSRVMGRLTDEQIDILRKHNQTGIPVSKLSDGKYHEMPLMLSVLDELEAYRSLGTTEELAGLVEKKKAGLLVELPERVWRPWRSPIGSQFDEVVGGRVVSFRRIHNGELSVGCYLIEWDKPVKDHFAYSSTLEACREIGKTIFLTPEAAEAALAGKERE